MKSDIINDLIKDIKAEEMKLPKEIINHSYLKYLYDKKNFNLEEFTSLVNKHIFSWDYTDLLKVTNILIVENVKEEQIWKNYILAISK